MTLDQFFVEAARTRDNLVTTPQAEQQMQRGQVDAAALAETSAARYEEWLKERAIPFDDLEGAEAEYAAMLDWLSIRGPIE